MCFSFVIRKVREKAAKRDKRQSEGEGRGEEGRVLFPSPLVFMFDLVFSLLSRFEKCAGLKVNVSKSEMLWLGSMRNRMDGVLDLKIRDEPLSTLQERLFFSYGVRRNFVDKLTKVQKHVKILVSKGHLSLQKDNYCENASSFQGHFFL